MKRIDIARDTVQGVAENLFQTEAAIDQAMTSIAGFAQGLPSASHNLGFATTRGQQVYERLAEAMVAQSQARARIVEVHGLLADLKSDSIVRTVAIGGGTKDTPPNRALPNTRVAVLAAVG